ncbi:MAG: hypothetical protein K2N38_06595 [Oscillospiraceae bacterium]|nr:hypothetical protein [Oscillospiraceae bacterium]
MKLKIYIAALLLMLSAFFAPTGRAYAESAVSLPERYLDEQELGLYDFVLQNVIAISEGRQKAEAFYYDAPVQFATKKAYEDAIEKVMFFVGSYNPEHLFWEDGSGYLVYDRGRCGIVYHISPAYQSAGSEDMIDKSKLPGVKQAFANAQAIADKYSGKSDYKKIIGFADEICALNTYNTIAADTDGYSANDITPWRIISVFDGDPSTNVVCAGYAQAFQYLCRLSGIECHYISGEVPEGLHAWNIVVLDGASWYVDLTFCDGFSEEYIKRDHPYVLNNVVSNSQDGFATYYDYSGYLSSDSTIYKYGAEELKYLPKTLLTISTGACRKSGLRFEIWHLLVLTPVVTFVYGLIKRRRSGDY